MLLLELDVSPLELPVTLTAPLLAVSPLLVGAPVSLSLADPPVLVGTVPELVPELLVRRAPPRATRCERPIPAIRG